MTPDLPPNVLRIRTSDGLPYAQLITNPDALTSPEGLRTSVDPVLLRVREYVHAVLTGDGTRSYCPFVEFIEKRNGYHVRDFSQQPNDIDFAPLIFDLADTFDQISQRPGRRPVLREM